MKFNIITSQNGVGLTQDSYLIKSILESLSPEHTVRLCNWKAPDRSKTADVNIFLEIVSAGWMPLGKYNIFIPNPDWFMDVWRPIVRKMDAVWCKTDSAVIPFKRENKNISVIRFTSRDLYSPNIQKQPTFFHLAGKSPFKGTHETVKAWAENPHFPLLTVLLSGENASKIRVFPKAKNIKYISKYIGDEELRQLININQFHICASSTEGWGHYIVEAMACKAVVLCTDAPPMNEIINSTDDNANGIQIKWKRRMKIRAAMHHYPDSNQISASVRRALSLNPDKIETISTNARQWFVDNDKQFREKFAKLVADLNRKIYGMPRL